MTILSGGSAASPADPQPRGTRIGSFCSGYGGLDMAVQQVFGGELAWVADIDPGASTILAHHWPDVPNLGDITALGWRDVPAVDIVCAGFPCQDLSYAGRGAGIKEGTRSGLWLTIARAVRAMGPRLVVLENVRAIVSRRPGLDVVLADLADLGFDARWTCVRASDVGAPHQRERWFLIATAQDTDGATRGERWLATPGQAESGRPRADTGRRGGTPAADAHGRGLTGHPERHRGQEVAQPESAPRLDSHGRGVQWGAYGPAITRWEHVTGCPAPRPTEPGRTGDRLTPAFVEWLMGLPAGHVTDVPGLSRNQMLHALGNGVVPQQAAYALWSLSDRAPVREVA